MAPADDYEEDDEYAHARKLVLRASDREAILMELPSSSDSTADFSHSALKKDHYQRPCWTCPDGIIYLEAFHDLYTQAYDFLVAIAEPVSRPEHLHEYKLTPYSLYAAVATNIETDRIIAVLERLSKNKLPKSVSKFITDCTQKYGKAKLVLKHNRFYVESEFPAVLRELLRDPTIAQARVHEDASATVDEHGFVMQSKAEEMKENLEIVREDSDSEEDEESPQQQAATVVSFQIKGEEVESVKRQAIELDYPLMEEYDFRNDHIESQCPTHGLETTHAYSTLSRTILGQNVWQWPCSFGNHCLAMWCWKDIDWSDCRTNHEKECGCALYQCSQCLAMEVSVSIVDVHSRGSNQYLYKRYKGRDSSGSMCLDYYVHYDFVWRKTLGKVQASHGYHYRA